MVSIMPFIRDEQGKRHQVVAAAQPGPAYQFMCAPEKEVGLAGNKGGGKTQALIMRMLSGVGRGWGVELQHRVAAIFAAGNDRSCYADRQHRAPDLGQGGFVQQTESRLGMEVGRKT